MQEPSLDRLRSAHAQMKEQLHRVIVGQDEVINQLLLAILTRGHCLLVGGRRDQPHPAQDAGRPAARRCRSGR